MSDAVSLTMGNSLFPPGYRLPGYTQPVCQLLLGKSMGFALGCDLFRSFHRYSSLALR